MDAPEAAVVDVLWDQGGWLTPGEVHEVLAADRPLAYTTVMTTSSDPGRRVVLSVSGTAERSSTARS
jgi:hypothetical protein